MSHKRSLATKKKNNKNKNSQNCSTCNVLGAVCPLITHKYVISAIYHGTTKLHLDGETAGTARKKGPACLFPPHISQVSRQKKKKRLFSNKLDLNFPKCLGNKIFRDLVNGTVNYFVVQTTNPLYASYLIWTFLFFGLSLPPRVLLPAQRNVVHIPNPAYKSLFGSVAFPTSGTPDPI